MDNLNLVPRGNDHMVPIKENNDVCKEIINFTYQFLDSYIELNDAEVMTTTLIGRHGDGMSISNIDTGDVPLKKCGLLIGGRKFLEYSNKEDLINYFNMYQPFPLIAVWMNNVEVYCVFDKKDIKNDFSVSVDITYYYFHLNIRRLLKNSPHIFYSLISSKQMYISDGVASIKKLDMNY